MDKNISIKITIISLVITALFGCNIRPEASYTQHILEITGKSNIGKFICPKGKFLRFVIGSPEKINKLITGSISVSHNKKIIYSSDFQFDKLQECNWLENDHQLKGQIIDWPNTIDKKLHPKENYDIEIVLNDIVPEKTSLWIRYVKLWVAE